MTINGGANGEMLANCIMTIDNSNTADEDLEASEASNDSNGNLQAVVATD